MEMSRRALMAAAGAAVVAAVIPWPEAKGEPLSVVGPIPVGEAWPWRDPKNATVTLYWQHFLDPLLALRFAEGLRDDGRFEVVKVWEGLDWKMGRDPRRYWTVYWAMKEP